MSFPFHNEREFVIVWTSIVDGNNNCNNTGTPGTRCFMAMGTCRDVCSDCCKGLNCSYTDKIGGDIYDPTRFCETDFLDYGNMCFKKGAPCWMWRARCRAKWPVCGGGCCKGLKCSETDKPGVCEENLNMDKGNETS